MSTTTAPARATARKSATSSSTRHDAFARAATLDAFRPRDARAFDHDDFVDRQPGEAPRQVGEAAEKVCNDTGMCALRHWLVQAAQAETEEEREVALEIAREIGRIAGIPHADLIGLQAA
jgi:hypothetical protein